MRRALAIGLLALVGGTVEAAAQVDDRIVFIANRPASEVHVMDADGTDREVVTRRAPAGFNAAWSPGGARFAFNGSSGVSFGLWVMDRDGGDLRWLGFANSQLEETSLPDPDWAPGGRRLVVSYRRDIHVVNTDGTGRRQLTRGYAGDWSPAWSPDGAWIVFTRDSRLFRVRTDGTGLQLLGRGDEADWSSNGKRIVFTVHAPFGGRDIYSMRADGTDRRRLTQSRVDEYAPAWSPGGTRIAYTRGFEGDVWVMDADGRNRRLLIADAAAPSWSPHGAFVSFTRGHTALFPGGETREVTAIFTRPVDGSASATRLLTPEFDVDVEASPDGAQIAYTSIRPFSTSGVYVADADGGNEMFLHPGEAPDWSPDGTKILLGYASGLYVVNPDGSMPTQLPEPASPVFGVFDSPRWHPDGARVSFVSYSPLPLGCAEVWAMNLDATNVTRMTRAGCVPHVLDFDWTPGGTGLVFEGIPCELLDCGPVIFGASVPDGAPALLAGIPDEIEFFEQPRVSPDGSKVTYVRYDGLAQPALWSMNLDGSGKRPLTSTGRGTAPAWLPDG
jgi:TolB protein